MFSTIFFTTKSLNFQSIKYMSLAIGFVPRPHQSPSRSSSWKTSVLVSKQGPRGTILAHKYGWGGWGKGVGLQPATSQSTRLEPWDNPSDFHSAAPPNDRGDFRAIPVEILVFASPTGYMLIFPGFPSFIWGMFYRFL